MVSAYELNFPYVDDGDSYTLSLDLTNNGNQDLDISTAYLTNNEFSASCFNCSGGCDALVEVNKNDKLIRFKGDYASEDTRGQLCYKGKFGYDYPNSSSRIKRSYIKNIIKLESTDNDNLFNDLNTNLKKYKPEEIGIIVSTIGKYNFYLGGDFYGTRLNRLFLELVEDTELANKISRLIDFTNPIIND